MKKLHLLLLCCFFALAASSQKVYFIYIQTEAEQAFYVKMNEKIRSSSASGYLILSSLVDSTYKFTIGFPQNKWPAQNYTVTLGRKDHGYLLKNFGEKGWGLFDLQTLDIQMGVAANGIPVQEKGKGEVGDVSAFTEILARAADDPTLKQKPVRIIEQQKPAVAVIEQPKAEEVKPVTETAIAKVETTAPVTSNHSGATAIAETPKEEQPVITIKEATTIVAEKTTDDKAIVKEAVPTEVKPVSADKPAAEDKAVVKETVPVETKPVSTDKPVEKTAVEDKAIAKETVPAETKPVPADKPVAEDKTIEKETVAAETKPVTTEKAKEVEEGTMKTETPVVVVATEGSTATAPVPKEAEATYKTSQVKKWSESSTTEGFGLVFIDNYEDGVKDTIRLIIPNPKSLAVITKEEVKEEKPFITTAELPKQTEVKATPTTNCTDIATDADFLKLRKRMAAVNSDDGMIAEAKKAFRVKCYTTVQVKNLAVLFLTDEGKYKFFDASYKYVSDAESFNSLQNELKDEYYATRFKAMLRN